MRDQARCGEVPCGLGAVPAGESARYDSGDAVSGGYQPPGRFKGGTILFVGVTVEKAQYLDL